MKRIIYFLSFILLSALYSCSEQYDNIDQYATDETVYVGKYSEDPYVLVGYKRLEIELFGDTVGRAYSDDLYVGRAKKTIIEYLEDDGLRRIERDSVCSWVNIPGLTMAKTYIFSIYAEDEYGNKSTPVEALGKPFTDDDFNAIDFPKPRVIASPTKVEFNWANEATDGIVSPLFKFVELIYSYVDNRGKTVSGKFTSKNKAEQHFNLTNLNMNDSTRVILNCRIIPIVESGQIIDTLTKVIEIVTKTTTPEEYLEARTMRTIKTALINPVYENVATVIFNNETIDHLLWTEVRFKNTSGDSTTVRIYGRDTEAICGDYERGAKFHYRCAYQPPETEYEFPSDWVTCDPFLLKRDYKRDGWVVIPRTGSHNWDPDGVGTQTDWNGGHPMLILDDDPVSGWHSIVNPPSPIPQVVIVDMRESRSISKIFSSGGYWKKVEFYLTDDLALSGYSPHTINWDADKAARTSSYNAWVSAYSSRIPAELPASWGVPIFVGNGEDKFTFSLNPSVEGRFLILRFLKDDGDTTYICIHTLEVYSD
jgi:hypothetical protein